MDEYLKVLGAAAFGALIGATLAWWNSRRTTQIKTAFDMHSEYFDDLVPQRELAVRFIASHKDAGDLAALWSIADAAKMEPVWRLVYFYERLWAAMEYRYIKRHLVPELFGASFNYWFEECFREQLVPVNDPIARHIADLHERIVEVKTSTEEQRVGWEAYRKVWQFKLLPADGAAGEGRPRSTR
ncbi:MAG: hypothetical protein ACXVJQ_18730 [Acidimicrobiia bacterium]